MNTNRTGFLMVFKNLCILVLCMKVASAFVGLSNGAESQAGGSSVLVSPLSYRGSEEG